jgi:hypothetical protein
MEKFRHVYEIYHSCHTNFEYKCEIIGNFLSEVVAQGYLPQVERFAVSNFAFCWLLLLGYFRMKNSIYKKFCLTNNSVNVCLLMFTEN